MISAGVVLVNSSTKPITAPNTPNDDANFGAILEKKFPNALRAFTECMDNPAVFEVRLAILDRALACNFATGASIFDTVTAFPPALYPENAHVPLVETTLIVAHVTYDI